MIPKVFKNMAQRGKTPQEQAMNTNEYLNNATPTTATTESPASVAATALMAMLVTIAILALMIIASPAYAEKITLPPPSSNGPCSGQIYWLEATGQKYEATLSATRPEAGCWIAVSQAKDKWCWVHNLPGVKEVYSGNPNCEAIGGGKCPSQEPAGRGCRTSPLGTNNWHAYVP